MAASIASITMCVSTSSAKGTVRWMAAELLAGTEDDNEDDVSLSPNQKADVWAFGMIVHVRSFFKLVPYQTIKQALFRNYSLVNYPTIAGRPTFRSSQRLAVESGLNMIR